MQDGESVDKADFFRRALRKRLLVQRQNLSPLEVKQRSQRVCDLFMQNLAKILSNSTKVISLYSSLHGEVDLDPLFEQRRALGLTCAFPRVEGQRLEFYPIANKKEMDRGSFGILEPNKEKLPQLSSVSPGVICVPGIAFSYAFGRIGYGAGFYDRYADRISARNQNKASPRPRFVGVCYDFQLVEELPQTSSDLPLDCIVSETQFLLKQET